MHLMRLGAAPERRELPDPTKQHQVPELAVGQRLGLVSPFVKGRVSPNQARFACRNLNLNLTMRHATAGVCRVSRRPSRLMSAGRAVERLHICPVTFHPRPIRGTEEEQGSSREATSQKYKSPQNPGRDAHVRRLVDFGCQVQLRCQDQHGHARSRVCRAGTASQRLARAVGWSTSPCAHRIENRTGGLPAWTGKSGDSLGLLEGV